MKRPYRRALLFGLCLLVLLMPAEVVPQDRPGNTPVADIKPEDQTFSGSRGFFKRYRPQTLPPIVLENSPRLGSLIRGGVLEITLADALALALENNLDIAVQRSIPSFSATDLLRSQAGQAPRGFPGASIPGGLTAGALGTGVSGAGGSGGVGSAGGITGGGGAVSVGSAGNFDPTISINSSWDRNTSPLNTIQVSGVPTVTGVTAAVSSSYAQLFREGTSYTLSLNGQRQSSTQQFLRFNPAFVTRFSLGVYQPLLNGFGFLPNERFIRVAHNNTKVSEELFRQQVITTVVAVANTYWDLAALQESVRVAERSLAVSERLLLENQMRVEIGTTSRLDVVAAQSEVASRARDLTIARTNLQLQEAALKNMFSKKVTPELDAARIVLKDAMPSPADTDQPELTKALAEAMDGRPDLKQAETALENQEIAIRYTENSMLPTAGVFGLYAGAGLQGHSGSGDTGLGDALWQTFKGTYPEYAAGASLSVSIKNRVAQADNLRAQLEGNQLRISMQRSRNQVALEVRKAIIGIVQGKAQVHAAQEAVRLSTDIYEGEKSRLDAGVSTSYQVILRERDLIAAQQAQVAAMVNYAKALVERDRAIGKTLERFGIQLADALSGSGSGAPARPSSSPAGNREIR